MVKKPCHVYQIAIKTTPEQVWKALTDPEKTTKFWFQCALRSRLEEGAPFELVDVKGEKKAEGIILAIEPPHRLTMRWKYCSFPTTLEDAPSRITWEIEPHHEYSDITLVSVVHDECEQAIHTAKVLENGVPIILSGLKTLLETGTTLINSE